MTGRRQVTELELMERIADGLGMPDHARMTLGLAPTRRSVDARSTDMSSMGPMATVSALPPSVMDPWGGSPLRGTTSDLNDPLVDPLSDSFLLTECDEESDSMRRRALLGLTGALLAGTTVGSATPSRPTSASFLSALTGCSEPDPSFDPETVSLVDLSRAVTAVKKRYQACRYSELIDPLPELLVRLRATADHLAGDQKELVEALSADAHHVAASLLLKLGDNGLAWLAADQSVRAARRSQDPVMLASSVRILTHAMVNGRHHRQAVATARAAAEALDSTVPTTPESLSVYGALLLRGGSAAARCGDRSSAFELLEEAEQAGRRLGGDHNYRWTAFGPTNVLLHRVNIAVTLGDAGQAIEYARRVDLDRVPIVERKAALFIDVARAFLQWGKYDRALHALRIAEELAPEEVSSRPAVRGLVTDLLRRAPNSILTHVRGLAHRVGAT